MSEINLRKIVGSSLIVLLSGSMIFHFLVLTGIINYNIIWGGRINSLPEMYRFESISVSTNIIFLLIVLLKIRILKFRIPPVIITIGIWIMAALFTLNTFGNLLSLNSLEALIFTPLTFITALFCIVLALSKEK